MWLAEISASNYQLKLRTLSEKIQWRISVFYETIQERNLPKKWPTKLKMCGEYQYHLHELKLVLNYFIVYFFYSSNKYKPQSAR